MPNMYAKFESVLSRTMVEQALTDPAVKSVLIEIAAQHGKVGDYASFSSKHTLIL